MSNSVGKALAVALLLLSGASVAGLDEVARLNTAGKHQQALEQLNSLPETRSSRLLRADALAGLKRIAEAEALYRALIAELPADPAPYNNLATLYAATGRLQEASELLNQAMMSDERYATIHNNLSQVYVAMSRNSYAKALRMSDQPQGLALRPLGALPAPLQVAAVAVPTAPASAKLQSAPGPRSLPKPAPAPVTAPALAPVTAPVPKPVAEPLVTPEPISPPPVAVARAAPQPLMADAANMEFDAGGAIAALRRWADEWSAQNVVGYLAAYDTEYLPPRGLSLAQWQAERRVRLRKPSKIEVTLSDFEVNSGGGGSLTVKLLQRYRSDNYRDTTRKGFVMVRRDGTWKIGDEYTIEVIN